MVSLNGHEGFMYYPQGLGTPHKEEDLGLEIIEKNYILVTNLKTMCECFCIVNLFKKLWAFLHSKPPQQSERKKIL